jgi:hypothetical protein
MVVKTVRDICKRYDNYTISTDFPLSSPGIGLQMQNIRTRPNNTLP